MRLFRRRLVRRGRVFSAVRSGEDAEEALDVGVRAHIPVAVEVRGGARLAAVARQAREEGLDVGVGADVAVAVEVGRAGGYPDGRKVHLDGGALALGDVLLEE